MNLAAALGGVRASLFAGLAVVALVFGGVQTFRLNAAHHSLEVQKLALVKSAKDFAEWKLKAEKEKAEAVASIDKQHREEQARAKYQADRTIAELRDGTRKLRNRLTCPAQGKSDSDAPPIGGVDGEGARGLTEEDAEFLVREAADSDRKSIKINSLIDVIEELLSTPKEK